MMRHGGEQLLVQKFAKNKHEAELKREEELLQRTLMSGTKKPHQKPVGLVKAKST